MIIFFILLVLLCFWKIKFSKFHDNYMGKDPTTSIKGIFAIIVLFSHMRGYVALSDSFLDQSYNQVLNFIGQLMVAIFFFYSGYGIIKSYTSKPDYSKNFFRCRLLKTLTHFDIAVLFYLLLSLATTVVFGWTRPWEDYVFAWVGWTSLGNSNWFIFTTLALYLITIPSFFLAEKINKRKELLITIFVTILSVALWIVLAIFKESWWYDTLFCYVFGMWFALIADKINQLFKEKPIVHYSAIAVSLVSFAATYYAYRTLFSHPALYSVCSCLFCITLVLVTSVVKINNPILLWLGKYSFSIYILQRLPMMVMTYLPFNLPSYLFAVLAIVGILVLAFIFGFIYKKIDNWFFKPKQYLPRRLEENKQLT